MTSIPLTTTTTTQQWILTKYSRSRSLPEPTIKRQKLTEIKDKNVSKQPPKQEFDHFIQPQLSLRLEITRSKPLSTTSEDLSTTHSMLLNVLYDPHYTSSQRFQPILLDSFDLMSFSTSFIRSHCPTDELPLKGVFKDEIVGLRYLFVETSSEVRSGFKRAQFKFEGKEERERFMSCVQGIIPFKPAESSTRTTYTASMNALPPPPPVPARSNAQTRRNRNSTMIAKKPPNSNAVQPFNTTRLSQVAVSHTPRYTSQTAQHPSSSSSFLPPPQPSNFPSQSLPPLPPLSQRGSTPSLTLPPHLTSHFPRLASAQAQSIEIERNKTGSQALLGLNEEEFGKLLGECLFEEGFEELVERVRGGLDLR
ncbi:hypothetical protein JCM5353_001681 [Sporobolomyces roseus]